MPAFFLDLIRYGGALIVGGGAAHRLVFEAADAVERGFVEPLQQSSKSASVSPGKPTMKVERSVRSGQIVAPLPMRASVFSCAAGRFMRFSTSGDACWNGMSR